MTEVVGSVALFFAGFLFSNSVSHVIPQFGSGKGSSGDSTALRFAHTYFVGIAAIVVTFRFSLYFLESFGAALAFSAGILLLLGVASRFIVPRQANLRRDSLRPTVARFGIVILAAVLGALANLIYYRATSSTLEPHDSVGGLHSVRYAELAAWAEICGYFPSVGQNSWGSTLTLLLLLAGFRLPFLGTAIILSFNLSVLCLWVFLCCDLPAYPIYHQHLGQCFLGSRVQHCPWATCTQLTQDGQLG